MIEKINNSLFRRIVAVMIILTIVSSPISGNIEINDRSMEFVENSSAQYDGYIYTISGDGDLRKMTTDFQTVWTVNTGLDSFYGGDVHATQDYVYASADQSVVKVDKDGNVQWNYTQPSNYVGSISVDNNGNVYSGTDGNVIHKISPDGNNIWTYSQFSSSVRATVISNGYLYAVGGNEIHKISFSGNTEWSNSEMGGTSYGMSANNGYIYASDFNGNFIKKFDSSGNVMWTNDITDPYGISVYAQDEIYTGVAGQSIHKLNDEPSTVYTTSGLSSNAISFATTPDNTVYIGGGNGEVWEMNGTTGNINNKATHSSRIIGGVARDPVIPEYDTVGYVEDESGNSIANADVTIRNSSNDIVHTGTTNSSGGWGATLTEGTYTITVTKNEYHTETKEFSASDGADVVLESQDISGTITDNDSNPIANADIEITDLSTGNIIYTHTTDSTGEYGVQVSDGNYQIDVSHSEYESESISVSVADSDVNRDIVMGAKPEVTGRFVNSRGYSASNIEITVLQDGNVVSNNITDSNGNFTFFVANGTYTLNATNRTYIPFETTIDVDGNTNLGELTIREKSYNFNLRVSPYMNHSTNQKYVAKFNSEIVNDNITITNSNSELITIDKNEYKLIATDNVSKTGEVNITAYYEVDGKNLSSSQNVTVAPIEIQHVEILSPLYKTLAIIGDRTIQYVILTVIAGVGVAMIINSFAGIGMMMLGLIIGWVIGFIPLGILLANVFGGIFIMMNTQLGMYERQR